MPLAPFATRHATNGMVSTVDHLATAAGIGMLQRDGSAVDAAIAANAVLAVTCQHMCGMGGDLFALVHDGSTVHALNASGRSGSGASADALRAEGHTRVPRQLDIRAVTVPGCVDGWVALHNRFGRLPLPDVLAAAIRLARHGFPATPGLAASVATLAHLPAAADYTTAPLRAGAVVRRPGVADALEEVARGGRTAFYEGRFGEDLLALGDGLFIEDDLRTHHAEWVTPLSLTPWRHTLWTIPPNSQGYLTLAATWLAARHGLPDDPDDPRWPHITIEAARLASYDRPQVLHEHADGDALIAEGRLHRRLARLDPDRRAEVGAPAADGGTTALCVASGDGTGVSLINSNAGGFGTGIATPAHRIFLQNRGLGFSLEPGHPAEYGPRRRPPHTLAPLLATAPDGRLSAVCATEGGDSQPHVLMQLLARMHAGNDVGAAMAAPRWRLVATEGDGFDTWAGDTFVAIEAHAPPGWAEGLRDRGHTVEVRRSFATMGLAHYIDVEDGVLAGAADPRHPQGAAIGT